MRVKEKGELYYEEKYCDNHVNGVSSNTNIMQC